MGFRLGEIKLLPSSAAPPGTMSSLQSVLPSVDQPAASLPEPWHVLSSSFFLFSFPLHLILLLICHVLLKLPQESCNIRPRLELTLCCILPYTIIFFSLKELFKSRNRLTDIGNKCMVPKRERGAGGGIN